MPYNIRPVLIALSSLLTVLAYSQTLTRALTKRIIIKTNILSLIAQEPSISVEKFFSQNFSTEFTIVKGKFNNILFTDSYRYNGLLLRAKKFVGGMDYGTIRPYGGAYAGLLERIIQTEGQAIGSNGYTGYHSRNFTGSSLRLGGSLGLTYISKSKIVIDGQASLGYGFYYKQLDKAAPDNHSNGYLDAQVWLSIGYCF